MGDHQDRDVQERRMSASSRREAGSGWTRARPGRGSPAPWRARSPPPPGVAGRRRWCGGRSLNSAMPTRASARSTQRSSSAPFIPAAAGPNATSSRTVGMKSWSSGSWKTMPTRRRTSRHVPLVHRQPGDRDRAGAAGQDAVEVEDERRLARAVRAEQRDPLAAGDGEVHAEEGPGARRGRRRGGASAYHRNGVLAKARHAVSWCRRVSGRAVVASHSLSGYGPRGFHSMGW